MTARVEDLVKARILAVSHAPREVVVTLRYSRADPYGVRIVFPAEATVEGVEVAWLFSRELLERGLRAPEGEGDVQLWPSGTDRTVVALHAPAGTATVEFATAALRRFLWRSYRLTPHGEEYHELDLDGALGRLLDGAQ